MLAWLIRGVLSRSACLIFIFYFYFFNFGVWRRKKNRVKLFIWNGGVGSRSKWRPSCGVQSSKCQTIICATAAHAVRYFEQPFYLFLHKMAASQLQGTPSWVILRVLINMSIECHAGGWRPIYFFPFLVRCSVGSRPRRVSSMIFLSPTKSFLFIYLF